MTHVTPMTAREVARALARLQQTRAQRTQRAEAERRLREGDQTRGWVWVNPDGSLLEMRWQPPMGPWHTLQALILAAEDVAHGIERRRRNGEMLTLEMVNRAILERVNRMRTIVGLRDEELVSQSVDESTTATMCCESERDVELMSNLISTWQWQKGQKE